MYVRVCLYECVYVHLGVCYVGSVSVGSALCARRR